MSRIAAAVEETVPGTVSCLFVAQSAGGGYHQENREPSSTTEYGGSGKRGSDRRWSEAIAWQGIVREDEISRFKLAH